MSDFVSGNQNGPSYCFMTLCPTTPDTLDGEGAPVAELRSFLNNVPQGPSSPFAAVPTIHLARFVVIDDLPYEGFPQHVDRLGVPYLLCSIDLSGSPRESILSLIAQAPEFVKNAWGRCIGFPGVNDREAFWKFLERCQIKTSFFFGGYPQATLDQVLKALDIQRRFAKLAVNTQQSSSAVLKAEFQRFLSECDSGQSPRPGSI
jgi:hypothetical protein